MMVRKVAGVTVLTLALGVMAGCAGPMPDGRIAARLTGLDGERATITFDQIDWFWRTSEDAEAHLGKEHPAAEAGPDDVLIDNSDPTLRTLSVAPDAQVIVLSNGVQETPRRSASTSSLPSSGSRTHRRCPSRRISRCIRTGSPCRTALSPASSSSSYPDGSFRRDSAVDPAGRSLWWPRFA